MKFSLETRGAKTLLRGSTFNVRDIILRGGGVYAPTEKAWCFNTKEAAEAVLNVIQLPRKA